MKNSGALCKISDCKISFFYIFKPEELENKWFRKNCKFSTQLFHWNNAFEAYWIGKIRALELCIACVLLLKNLLPAEKLKCIGTLTLVMTHDHDHELQKTVPMLSWFCQNSSCTTYPSIIIHLNTSSVCDLFLRGQFCRSYFRHAHRSGHFLQELLLLHCSTGL